MHDTAMLIGSLFLEWALTDIGIPSEECHVVDLGGLDVNGSLHQTATEKLGMKYSCVDMEAHESVDFVVAPNQPLPFADHSVHIIVSSSCFEHDPCFWMTFREMCRILHPKGFIYVNAPSNGVYHGYPGDNWRFYTDAAQALAVWASNSFHSSPSYPMQVREVFHVLPLKDMWIDYVAIWSASDSPATEIVTPQSILCELGSFQKMCIANGMRTLQLPFSHYPYDNTACSTSECLNSHNDQEEKETTENKLLESSCEYGTRYKNEALTE